LAKPLPRHSELSDIAIYSGMPMASLLHAAARAEMWQETELTERFGTRVPIASLLSAVGASPGLSQIAYGRALNMDNATLGRHFEALTTRGFLSRQRSRTDQRQVHVFLTREGEAALAEIRDLVDKSELRVAQLLGTGQIDGLRRALVGLLTEATGHRED